MGSKKHKKHKSERKDKYDGMFKKSDNFFFSQNKTK